MLREWSYSFLPLHELTYERRNFICSGIKSEVTTLNRPMLREWSYSFLPLHELTYERCNFICSGIKSEVPGVDNVNLSLRYIPLIGFRLRKVE